MRQTYLKNMLTALLLVVLAAACEGVQVPDTSGSTSVPTISVATNSLDEVEFTDFSITPISEDEVAINACTKGQGGVGITLKVSYNTSPNGDETGEWIVLKELGVPCFNAADRPTWKVGDLKPGKYLIKVEAKTADDPNWTHPVSKTLMYEVR